MAPRVPSLTARRLITVLCRSGFLLDHTTGSHYVFYHPITRRRVVVPYHTSDLPRGTLMSIIRQSGLDPEVFS